MILEKRELELAAVGVSISAGCVPCTRFHIKEAENVGASDQEIVNCLRIGVEIANNSLSEMQRIFDPEASADGQENRIQGCSRQLALTAVGAAVSRNSVGELKLAIKAARESDVDDCEIMEVAGLASRIKEKAASHLEGILVKLDADPSIASNVANLCT